MLGWLERWVGFCARHCLVVLAALSLLTLVGGYVAATKFSMNSDLGKLIRQDQPWRADFDRYEAQFPHLVNTLVVLVAGDSRTQTDAVTLRLAQQLSARTDVFDRVSAPAVEPFLRQHALLFLSLDELDDVVDELALAQPMLAAVAADPSLRSIFTLLAESLEAVEPGDALDEGTVTALRLLRKSASALLEGDDPAVHWGDEFISHDGKTFRVIVAEGSGDFDAPLPNAQLLAAAQTVIQDTKVPAQVSVALTGEVALAHEEIQAALVGVQRAGWVSLALLLVVLAVGVRSLKIIAGTFLLLLIGVIWTSAYAMLTVGEYNTLSVVFLVMFFGLGVDFALHFSLRYQEALTAASEHNDKNDINALVVPALVRCAGSVGRAIGLCTITSAIAFMGFWPTQYQGLADLGVISAGGMVVAALLTFTFLPAWYGLVGKLRRQPVRVPTAEPLIARLIDQRKVVLCVLAGVVVVAGWSASRTHFDYSVLALRDEGAESMRALRTLQAQDLATDYSLAILAAKPHDYESLAQLEQVASVATAADVVPSDQAEKLLVLEDAQQLLWNLLDGDSADIEIAPSALALEQALVGLIGSLERYAATVAGEQQEQAQLALSVLRSVLSSPSALLSVWQPAVVQPLVAELQWLRGALLAQPFRFDDLPASIARNYRSDQGQFLAVANPARDLSSVAALSDFIAAVHVHAPSATGRPVIELGVGQIVIESFYTALALAVVGVFLVLLVTFRRLTEALLILVPLALALLLTLAIGVWFDEPLNMASILVLPLIFGLGVDNGIHVVDRFRSAGTVHQLMNSSTPRAVVLSTLTTIGAFASLMLSPHQGTASIGFLLTCSVSLVLLLTVFLLPVLLNLLVPAAGAAGTAPGVGR